MVGSQRWGELLTGQPRGQTDDHADDGQHGGGSAVGHHAQEQRREGHDIWLAVAAVIPTADSAEVEVPSMSRVVPVAIMPRATAGRSDRPELAAQGCAV